MYTINGKSAAKPLNTTVQEERSTTIETALAKEKGVEYTLKSGNGRNLRNVYIYALICPKTKHIRYVGKSVEPYKRYLNHLTENSKTHKNNWLKSLNDDKPEFMILDICNEEDWIFWEQYWISQCKTWGYNLTNMTIGGDGSSGMKLSEDHKLRISKSLIGHEVSLETRSKISKSNKGVKKSLTHIENLKLAHKGKAPKTKKRFVRKIEQYENDKLIKIWDSIKEASKYYNVNPSSISHCCAGRKKTIKGYTWKYFQD